MKASQYTVIGNLIKRKRGATAAELLMATCSTSVHKRMSEMRARGWLIQKESVPGKNYHVFKGYEPGCWTTKAA